VSGIFTAGDIHSYSTRYTIPVLQMFACFVTYVRFYTLALCGVTNLFPPDRVYEAGADAYAAL
jgi:hypothetical protein